MTKRSNIRGLNITANKPIPKVLANSNIESSFLMLQFCFYQNMSK